MAGASIRIDCGDVVEIVSEIKALIGDASKLPDHIKARLLQASKGEGDLVEYEVTPGGIKAIPSGGMLALLADLRARAR